MRTERIYTGPQARPLGDGYVITSRLLMVALALVGLLALGCAAGTLGVFGLIGTSGHGFSLRNFDRAHILTLLMSALINLPLLATMALQGAWLYQATCSDRVDPTRMPHQRWWAAAGWLIPIFNLFRPYQMAHSVWSGTAARATTASPVAASAGQDRIERLPSMSGWWAGWVLSFVLSAVASLMLATIPDDPYGAYATLVSSTRALRVGAVVSAAGMLALAASALCGIFMVRTVTAATVARIERASWGSPVAGEMRTPEVPVSPAPALGSTQGGGPRSSGGWSPR